MSNDVFLLMLYFIYYLLGGCSYVMLCSEDNLLESLPFFHDVGMHLRLSCMVAGSLTIELPRQPYSKKFKVKITIILYYFKTHVTPPYSPTIHLFPPSK